MNRRWRWLRWADSSLIDFNDEKRQILHVGRNNPIHHYMLGTLQLEISSAEKDLRILVNTKLNIG